MIQENPGKTEDAVQAKIDRFMSMVWALIYHFNQFIII